MHAVHVSVKIKSRRQTANARAHFLDTKARGMSSSIVMRDFKGGLNSILK